MPVCVNVSPWSSFAPVFGHRPPTIGDNYAIASITVLATLQRPSEVFTQNGIVEFSHARQNTLIEIGFDFLNLH